MMPLAKRKSLALFIRPTLLLLFCSLVLGSMSGCHLLTRFNTPQPKPPIAFDNVPVQSSLMDQIRRNTSAVRQLTADVKVSTAGMPNVRGTLILERPQRLRLKVGALGMPGLDIGSNDERFWIYNQTSLGGQTPAIYFASHQAYASSSLQQTLQLRPQWIIDALGLVELAPGQAVKGPFPRQDGRYELRSTVPTANGPMTRLTVVDPQYGWIIQQSVYDANHRRIFFANSTKYQYFPEHQASLPRHIELHIFDPTGQETTLTLRMSNMQLNALYVDPAQAWRMPNPADVPQVDLTKVDLQSQHSGLGSPSAATTSWRPPGPPTRPTGTPIERSAQTPWQPRLKGLERF